MKIRLLPLLLALPLTVSAEVFRTVDEHGNVTFSDQPSKNAERVKLPPVPTYSAPPAPPITAGAPEQSDPDDIYKSMRITSPENDAAVRENSGNLTVSLALQPGLSNAQGHRIQVYLNGSPVGEPGATTNFSLTNLDRGTHTLNAAVLDGKGRTLIESDIVTFHMMRVTAPRKQPRS